MQKYLNMVDSLKSSKFKFKMYRKRQHVNNTYIVYIILDEWLSYEDDLNISYLLRNPQLIYDVCARFSSKKRRTSMVVAQCNEMNPDPDTDTDTKSMHNQDFDLVKRVQQAQSWLSAMRWIQIQKVCTIKILILWTELNVKHGRGSMQCNESRRCL